MTPDDRLDALLAQHFQPQAGGSAPDDDTAARVLAALPHPLPPQRRAWRRWPVELLDWTFAPAWPRLAALAGCAALGFAIGVASPLLRDRDSGLSLAQRSDGGIAMMLSEPEPLTGALP